MKSMGREDARRYGIVAASIVGLASMTPPSLLQLGVVSDLPDPKRRWFGLPFDSKKVNLSNDAFVLGVRDAPLALAGFLANVPLVLLRRRSPWIAIVTACKALGEAVGALVFFQKMPRKERAWCGYCVVGALASVSVLALAIPEAVAAARALRSTKRSVGYRRSA